MYPHQFIWNHRGIAFSANGLKMYAGITNNGGGNGLENVFEYDLVCPFNIFQANVLQLQKIAIELEWQKLK